jgi:hypothetical protein
LDNARQFWDVVQNQLGGDTLGSPASDLVDTANVGADGPIVAAVNSCVRKIVASLGIVGREKVVITVDTYGYVQPYYTLQGSFIEDGIAARPFSVMARTGGGVFYGLTRASSASEMSNPSPPAAFVALWWLSGDQLWVNDPREGDTLFVEGPIAGTAMTDGADVPNVLDQDRSAVCDCATAIVGKSTGFSESQFFWELYRQHIIDRGGAPPPERIP